MASDVSKIIEHIKYLKDIDTKYPNFLSGNYYHDIKLILNDYVNIKTTYLALLQSTGQDSDKIIELTVLNDKLTRENTVKDDKINEFKTILDEILKLVDNYYNTNNTANSS